MAPSARFLLAAATRDWWRGGRVSVHAMEGTDGPGRPTPVGGWGSPDELADFLAHAVRQETVARFTAMLDAQRSAGESVAAARDHVEHVLGLQVWAHKLFRAVHAGAHAHGRP